MITKYNLRDYSAPILRVGMAIVFLWFGFSQIKSPENWIGFLPSWTAYLFLPGASIVFINGIFEVIFGSLLVLGLFTRVSAFLLSLHLFVITLSLNGPTAVRDLGLTIATLAVLFRGRDQFCLDRN